MHKYRLICSARKTLALEVDREGEITVRAPYGAQAGDIDSFVEKHEAWLQKALERQARRRERYPEPGAEEELRCIAAAKAVLPEKVREYAGRMGVTPGRVKITGARKRFGSCSGKNSICFSWRLMLYPEAAIDYVVVHELAHIRYKNHGRDFYAFIECILPDYREREKMLK